MYKFVKLCIYMLNIMIDLTRNVIILINIDITHESLYILPALSTGHWSLRRTVVRMTLIPALSTLFI